MKKCSNCDALVNEGDSFCQHCGKNVDEQPFSASVSPEQKTCPYCGAIINENDTFCQNCGKNQNEVPDNESIVYEEETKSGVKKYLPYILGGVILLGLIGYCSSNGNDNTTNVVAAESTPVVENAKMTSEQEIQAKKEFIETFYKGLENSDYDYSYIKKHVSPKALQLLKDEYDYDCYDGDCLGVWLLAYEPGTECDFSTVVSHDVKEQNENDYLVEIKYVDPDYGILEYDVLLTVVKDGDTYKIDNIEKKRFINAGVNTGQSSNNTDWLQGHWVYEQGNYKGHFIIQDDKIIQYSSMNPERDEATFRIEDDEIRARLIDGMDLVVKIDFANQRIDYGDGCWMHKTNLSSNDYSSSPSNTSSSRTFANEQYVTMYLADQKFCSSDGFTIRFDDNLRMYAEGDYAGVVSVLRYNSTSALLRYGGGMYGEGRITVQIIDDRLQLIDPTDGSVYYQK